MTYSATDSAGNTGTVTRALTLTGDTLRFAGSTAFGLYSGSVHYMNLKNASESIGFSESVLSSAAYFKSPSYIFTFACKFMKNDGSGYPRMLSIMKGTLANASSLLFVVTGSNPLNFSCDGGLTIGDNPICFRGVCLYDT